jgi:hypothetical protein
MLPDGLYIEVYEGAIIVYNKAGSRIFTVGQFGYVSGPDSVPALLDKEPELPPFSPPPSVPPLIFGFGGPPSGTPLKPDSGDQTDPRLTPDSEKRPDQTPGSGRPPAGSSRTHRFGRYLDEPLSCEVR